MTAGVFLARRRETEHLGRMHRSGEREQVFRDWNRALQPGYVRLLDRPSDYAENDATSNLGLGAGAEHRTGTYVIHVCLISLN